MARGWTKDDTIQDRFWAKVNMMHDCWLWEGATTRTQNGYGRFRYKGNRIIWKW